MRPAFVEYELAAAVGKEYVHGVIDRLVQVDRALALVAIAVLLLSVGSTILWRGRFSRRGRRGIAGA